MNTKFLINSNDISVIVQGAINKTETKKCLASIRKFLPDAEIILSTWKGSCIDDLDYDILVLNDDPGAVKVENFKNKIIFNNINRQLISTKEGLKKATRKYAFKLRSDLILKDNRIFDYFDEFSKRTCEYQLFKHKILTSTLFTRFDMKLEGCDRMVKMPFHISDWWFFGLTEDLRTYLSDTSLVQEPEFTNYFSLEENKNKDNPYGKIKFKFAPEQYFAYECFSRNFDDIYMEDAADYSDELMEKFRKCLINNFIVLEFEQSGIYLNKYPYSKNEKYSGSQYLDLYNFYRYECEYKELCDSNYKIKTHDNLFVNKKIGYAKLRIYKHISKFLDDKTSLLNKCEHLLLGIPIAVVGYLFVVIKEKIKDLITPNISNG